jgi:hypothetical protein
MALIAKLGFRFFQQMLGLALMRIVAKQASTNNHRAMYKGG